MEPTSRQAFEDLQTQLLLDEAEKRMLRTIIAYTESPERREQAVVELAKLVVKMGMLEEELAGLETENY